MDDILDIDYVLKCLSEISESDLYSTKHFEIRVNQRKNDLFPDLHNICSIILKDKPVSISKQDDIKFKLVYKLNDNNDLTIIISRRTLNPISFNLVTSFIEKPDKRLREDK